MEKKQFLRMATAKIKGVKKRCRKESSQIVDAYGKDDIEALDNLKVKLKEVVKNYRTYNDNNKATCQNVTFIYHDGYTVKKFSPFFCESMVIYDITL